jgi:phage anti-repressor protein
MEDFLKKYSDLPKEFIKDFYSIVKEDVEDTLFCIDFDTVVKWLNSRKDNVKKVLKKHFSLNYDYTSEVKKIIKFDGGATRKEIIKITPECFKSLCMLSHTERGKEVRKYFLEMEKLVKQYHNEIQEKIKKELQLVKANQKPKFKSPNESKKGKVYVFEAFNTTDTLYKLGKSDDLKTRLGTYNTGLANDLEVLFELEVDDIHSVEKCAKRYLKEYQYRKYKEVYETSLVVVSKMLEECSEFMKKLQKIYELHKKTFKKSAERLKNKEGRFFMFFDK